MLFCLCILKTKTDLVIVVNSGLNGLNCAIIASKCLAKFIIDDCSKDGAREFSRLDPLCLKEFPLI